VASVWIWKKPYSYDSVEYIQMAQNLQQGLYYSGNAALPLTEHYMTLRPPVYPAFILSVWTLFGTHTWIILLLQNIMSVATGFLVRNMFLRWFPKQRDQWIYWLFIILYPMQMVFANMIFCDVLFQLFLMLYLGRLLRFLQDKRQQHYGWMALWLIAGVFTKPILYPFLIVHLLFALIFTITMKKGAILITAAVPLVLVLGYGYINQARTGIYHISSVQSYNLLEYNLTDFYRFRYGPEVAAGKMDVIKKELDNANNFPEYYERSAAIAGEKIKAEFIAYSLFHAWKSVLIFFDPNKLEFDIFSRRFHYINNYQESFATKLRTGGWRGAWSYLKGYPFFLLLILTPVTGFFRLTGFILFACNRRFPLKIRIALVIFVGYFAFITGPVANARYFLPMLMVTSACSWISFSTLWQGWKFKHKNTHVPVA